jgi:hypothetical protein
MAKNLANYDYCPVHDADYRFFYKYTCPAPNPGDQEEDSANARHSMRLRPRTMVGYIPCEVSVMYRRRSLSTVHLMQLIHALWLHGEYPKSLLRHCPMMTSWYMTPKGTFDVSLLYNMTRLMEKQLEGIYRESSSSSRQAETLRL